MKMQNHFYFWLLVWTLVCVVTIVYSQPKPPLPVLSVPVQHDKREAKREVVLAALERVEAPVDSSYGSLAWMWR